MAKNTNTQKEPVRIREKRLSNGNISLYLDILGMVSGTKNI